MTILLAIIVGLAFGVVFERHHICMNSAITHVFLFGGTHKLRRPLIAVLVSTMLFNLLIASKVVKAATMPLWPTTVFAGVIFGIGMNLAGGCVSGTLFKMGQGYLASWIAFLGLALSFGAAELTLAPMLGIRTELWEGTTMPMILGVSPLSFAVLTVGAGLAAYWTRVRHKRKAGTVKERHGIDWSSPTVIGALIAILNAITFVILSHPLGLTGLMSIPFFIGALLSALATGRFRLRRPSRRQAVSSFFGGILMGSSTSVMGGCNVTHILGGVPQFGLGSLVATVGIVVGAWFGSKLVLRIAG